jgi:hypothetical protein
VLRQCFCVAAAELVKFARFYKVAAGKKKSHNSARFKYNVRQRVFRRGWFNILAATKFA